MGKGFALNCLSIIDSMKIIRGGKGYNKLSSFLIHPVVFTTLLLFTDRKFISDSPVHWNCPDASHLNFLCNRSKRQQLRTFLYQSRGSKTKFHKTKDITHNIMPWNSYKKERIPQLSTVIDQQKQLKYTVNFIVSEKQRLCFKSQ